MFLTLALINLLWISKIHSMVLYDLCVVGAGMFGSAAARHASANPSIKVCLIGPNEPTPSEYKNRDIFSSHYDAGRITRILDDDPACEVLSKQSIQRYRELERLSGIKFYTPVGCLFIAQKNGTYFQSLLQAADAKKVSVVTISSHETFKMRYPYLRLKDDEVAVLDDNGGGHIDPRKMVQAQIKVAKLQGCDVNENVASEVNLVNDTYQIKTENGDLIKAKRLLIATGCFVNTKNINVLNALSVSKYKETAALFKVSEDEVKRLSSLPDVIYQRGSDETFPNGVSAYFLPPIKYPDGSYYLKIGVDGNLEGVKDLDDIKEWYRSKGDEDLLKLETNLIKKMLPGLKYESSSSKTCVNCDTPNKVPYIDRVTPTLTVAIAGNGKGAKFSDEVGRLAAQLSITGNWDSELRKDRFEAIFQKRYLIDSIYCYIIKNTLNHNKISYDEVYNKH